MPGPVRWRGRWGAPRSCSRRCGATGAHMGRGQLPRARELAAGARTGPAPADPLLLVAGHRMLANTAWWQGELVEAQAHAKQGLACYDPAQHRAHAVSYGQDSGVACSLGAHPLDARLSGPGAAGHGGGAGPGPQSGDLMSLVCPPPPRYGPSLRREPQAAWAQAEDMLALCTEQGFGMYRAWSLAPGAGPSRSKEG